MTTEMKRSTEIQRLSAVDLKPLASLIDYLDLDLAPQFPSDLVLYGADSDLFWIKPLAQILELSGKGPCFVK